MWGHYRIFELLKNINYLTKKYVASCTSLILQNHINPMNFAGIQSVMLKVYCKVGLLVCSQIIRQLINIWKTAWRSRGCLLHTGRSAVALLEFWKHLQFKNFRNKILEIKLLWSQTGAQLRQPQKRISLLKNAVTGEGEKPFLWNGFPWHEKVHTLRLGLIFFRVS